MPVVVATFALILIGAAPSAMATHHLDDDKMKKEDKMKDDKHDKSDKMIVEGFVGELQLTQDIDKKALKDMVSVSLSNAAQGLDVIKGELELIANENGEKFLVWKLKSVEKDPESDMKTKTIYIIDAANIDNAATITKEYEHKMKDDRYKDSMTDKSMNKNTMTTEKMKSDNMEMAKTTGTTEKRTMTAPPVSAGVGDSTDLRSQFVDKIQELQDAYASGDNELISEIRQDLNELKTSILQSIAT